VVPPLPTVDLFILTFARPGPCLPAQTHVCAQGSSARIYPAPARRVMLPEYESDGEEMPSPLTGVSGAAAKDPAAAAAADTEPLLAMQVLLHAADLSNVSKEWHIHVQWTHRVLSEFFSQGDLERHLGKQVSPHCVRDLRQGRTNQKQFLLKCVLPLYQLGMRAVPHGRQHFETCIGQMKLNAQRWEELGY
jgi:hypothetical protein